MTDETPIELVAKEIAPELKRLLDAFLSLPDGDDDRSRSELRTYLWDNKIGLLRIAQTYGPMVADLRETLRMTLHHCGPDATHKITTDAMLARKARESNDEMDRLEAIFGHSNPGGK